ncbi:MAG: type II toxin-antitoxin system HicB family antitoxin [Clostridiales bacterium]|jgi:predicted RNase H-like HicB family nuclease|nr:type II toxin-antitoxin system HicB family antitoxin [Clostridiales bacterium]
MATTTYPAVFAKADNAYTVYFPDFRATMVADEVTLEDAIDAAKELIAMRVYSSDDLYKFEMPEPSKLEDVKDGLAKGLYGKDLKEASVELVTVDIEKHIKENF